MPVRRGMGGLSSGAGGNLFDRPGFFDFAEIITQLGKQFVGAILLH